MTEFWPDDADDFMKIAMNLGGQENNWLRQCAGYWSMAASFVEAGAINADLFLAPSISGEMFFIFAKVYPFLKEVREKLGDPEALRNVERVINGTKYGRERLQLILQRVAAAKEQRRASATKAG